jgi:uncharacterized protein (DUF885 family)
MRCFLAAAALIAFAVPAAAAPQDDLKVLMEEHYRWSLQQSPTYATSLGVRDYDDRIDDLSPAARSARVREAKAFLIRLDRIPAAQLAAGDRVNHAILRRDLTQIVEADRFPQRNMLFTTYYGWHQGFAGMADNLPFRTRAGL